MGPQRKLCTRLRGRLSSRLIAYKLVCDLLR